MVDDIIHDMMFLDMKTKLESLWWTSFSWEVFYLLGCRFGRSGKGIQGTDRTVKQEMGSWWRECERVVSHVSSTRLTGSLI